MKRTLMVIGQVLLAASFALAGAPNGHQATGPAMESHGDNITVRKGYEKWKSPSTRTPWWAAAR